jgi:hypothetical protein
MRRFIPFCLIFSFFLYFSACQKVAQQNPTHTPPTASEERGIPAANEKTPPLVDQLRGSWQLVEQAFAGQPLAGELFERLEIDENSYTLISGSASQPLMRPFTLEDKSFVFGDGEKRNIYKLIADTLIISRHVDSDSLYLTYHRLP